MSYYTLLTVATREHADWVEATDRDRALQYFSHSQQRNLTFDRPESAEIEPVFLLSEYPTPALPPPDSAIWRQSIPVYEL